MATKTLTKAASIERYEKPARHKVVEAVVDFLKTANQLAQNDVAEVIDIPADCRVDRVRWEVLVVEGAARNFSIGDGADAAGYLASTSGNALAEGVSSFAGTLGGTGAAGDPVVITGYSDGKYYPTADTLDITAVTAGGLVAMKLKVTAELTLFS